MMRSSAYNRFGVLMGTSSRASCPRWLSLRGDSLPMITLISSQGDFCATAFLAINLLAAVVPIRGRKSRWVLLLCLVVAFVGRGGTSWLDQAVLVPTYLALWTVVALLAAASALRFALVVRVGDRAHLYAGLSAYLLAGIFFGVFYWVLERIWPGSLAVP